MMAAGYGEAVTASVGAKGGSFLSIGITGKPNNLMTVTKRHGRVHTTVRYAAELR
jgi:hypothetical protein